MSDFQLPADLKFNRALIDDPRAYFEETGCASWLFIVGGEFASMPGGMSYAQVQDAAARSAQVICTRGSRPARHTTM